MSNKYEYMGEATIDLELICSICRTPFDDPCCTSCGETFCRKCITHWIEAEKGSCPHCRQTLSTNTLNKVPRPLQNMLDRLRVKCTTCGQTELQRGNFDDHIEKLCPKMVIPCRSADIKCPWTGQRDQLNQHLVDCRFELMRPVITQFIAENQQLKDQVNQQTIKITSRENIIETHLSLQKQLLSEVERQQKENQQLKDQGNEQTIYIGEQQRVIRQLTTEVTQLTTQFNACQRQLQHLNAQTSQKNTQITSMANQSSE